MFCGIRSVAVSGNNSSWFILLLKIVGQQHVKVKSDNLGKDIRVDKDVELIREHFHLHHIDYEHMSPIIIPSGYTKVCAVPKQYL